MSERNRLPVGRQQLRAVPTDLAVILLLLALTDLLVLLPLTGLGVLRVPFSLLLAAFLPGYALIAALFPKRGRTTAGADGTDRPDDHAVPGRLLAGRSISGIERVLLSVGTSVAVVPLIGLVLDATPAGLRLVPVTLSVSAFTVIAALAGIRRRWALPPEDRFAVPFGRWLGRARRGLTPTARFDWMLNIVFVVSLLVLASTVAYTLVVPREGEQFTEFYLLTENDSGELVASGYPTTLEDGEARPLVVGVSNHEGQPVNYTIVVELQRIESSNGTTTVIKQRQLSRFRMRVGANETQHRQRTIEPTLTGSRLRLTYLLYRGAPPQDPTVENAYRETHLFVDVSENGTSARRATAHQFRFTTDFSPVLAGARPGSVLNQRYHELPSIA
jgi:uncharacterized membrane protein